MKKILIVSTVSRQFYLFEQGNIEVLKSLGCEIHAAANYSDANERLDSLDIIRHHLDIERSPFSFKNLKAYRQLKKIMESEKFDAVHCHSPMGGVLARLAAKAADVPNVIYTAHGFHFYKGAPLINWLIYYPVENFLSGNTEMIITINKEDFERAKGFNANRIEYVPGIGIPSKKYKNHTTNKDRKRQELGLPKDAFIVLSVGELNKNKNHETIINAIAKLKDPNVFYIICGQGKRNDYLKNLTKSLGLTNNVKFLGFRNDLTEIYRISDVFAFPSYREGLSVSLMEAMATGLPIVCSAIRGNIDLIDNGLGGYLMKPNDIDSFKEAIEFLQSNPEVRSAMSQQNLKRVEICDIESIKEEMKKKYISILLDNRGEFE